MESSIFSNQFDRLASEFRCLAPDLPGHGGNPNGTPTVAGAAQALHTLLMAEDLRDVILVGWSLGASVGWRYFSSGYDGRVAGMISVDMSPKMVNEAGWTFGLRGRDTAACLATTSQFRNHWAACIPAIAAGMFADSSGSTDLPFDQAVERIASNDPSAMVAMWESLLASDARDGIARLPVPLLATHGGASRVYSRDTARWLASKAPKARYHEFGGSGHSPHLEEPDDFADVIRKFAEATSCS